MALAPVTLAQAAIKSGVFLGDDSACQVAYEGPQALSFSFYFPSIGNNLISPSDITSTASAARIKPIRRVMTLIPVLPKPRAIGRASEKHSAVASAMTTP